MSLVQVTDLTFHYEGSYDNIFERASFSFDTAWKLGFVGRNGRGKTTFLNLLTGKYPYQGRIEASVAFEYFPYPVPDAESPTRAVLGTACPGAEDWRVEREVSLLGVDPDVLERPFSTLSNGERTKALIAAMFLRENSFLLIDEPTNHLDMAGRAAVAKYLNAQGGFLVVSHDRAFLDACVDHILSINRSTIEVQAGNFSSWFYNKELHDSFELEKNARLKKDIRRLTETAREKADWSDCIEKTKIGAHASDRGRIGHLAARMMKRSKAIETRKNREIEEKKKLLKDIERADSLKIQPLSHHAARLVELREVSISYGTREVVRGANLLVERGDRAALRGGNGSGKTSLLRLILGESVSHAGVVRMASGLKISYVPQDPSFLSGALQDYIDERGVDGTLMRAILRKLDFARVQFEKDMKDLSAGQKKKVLVARSLCERAHLYVWDEPLNYVDVLSRMQIEELLAQYEPTMLFVEHDAAFCDNVATKIVEL